MFPAAPLSVVFIANDNPFDAFSLIISGNGRHSLAGLSRQYIFASTSGVRIGIRRTHQHVIAEFVQMPPVTQPCSGRRDVISSSLAFGFHQYGHIDEILATPGRPWRHDLQPFAIRRDLDVNIASVGRGDIGPGRNRGPPARASRVSVEGLASSPIRYRRWIK